MAVRWLVQINAIFNTPQAQKFITDITKKGENDIKLKQN